MQPKQGILHDYDLHANHEPAAQKPGNRCAVCDTESPRYQWSDYSGEGMCCNCGCPYQLKWGSDKQLSEGLYPYLNLKEEFVPIAREYWAETGAFVCFGWMMGPRPGVAEFNRWVETKHPEMLPTPPAEGSTP